ncbi:MAG TPA: ferritin-like domain-containing protein [Gemmatimonadales bacterium]|nr:ferritin-like domain-containing protein [Gemmatimonadales bacterium]
MEALQKLLVDELGDLYDAEQQIVKALPKLIQESSSPELQKALKEHLTVTEEHVQRLEEAFSELGESQSRRKCKGMAGLLAEGEDLLKEDFEESTKDAGIIGAAQRVEHYEIAAYGTARTLAQTLGNSRVAELLQETLDEEKEADELLTQIAESTVNTEAASEESENSNERSGNGRSRSSTAPKSKSRNTRTRSRRTRARAGR